jgi:hypothetical protein
MSNSNQMNVLDLAKCLKIAREHACLGLYPDSLNYFKKCLKTIQKYLYFITLIKF